jgi:hypothetical protein
VVLLRAPPAAGMVGWSLAELLLTWIALWLAALFLLAVP